MILCVQNFKNPRVESGVFSIFDDFENDNFIEKNAFQQYSAHEKVLLKKSSIFPIFALG